MVESVRKRQTTAIDRYVGSCIRRRRRALRMAQKALAAKTGMTVRELQRYERGLVSMEAEKVFRIAKALETPVSSFLDGLPLAGPGIKPSDP